MDDDKKKVVMSDEEMDKEISDMTGDMADDTGMMMPDGDDAEDETVGDESMGDEQI